MLKGAFSVPFLSAVICLGGEKSHPMTGLSIWGTCYRIWDLIIARCYICHSGVLGAGRRYCVPSTVLSTSCSTFDKTESRAYVASI